MKNWWALLLLVLILIVGGVWYLYQQNMLDWERHEIREFFVPDEHAKTLVEIGEKYDIPWYYLAAIEEARYDYEKTNRESLETLAKEIRQTVGEDEIEDKEFQRVLEQENYRDLASKILAIANSYRWQAAILTEPYAFPFPDEVRGKVSYSNSWGDPRSFGGKRQHEGIDLFAPQGTPLIALTDGKVVRKGWNKLGGWRIMIQDEKYPQFFYYYAHLSKYAEGLEEGDVVSKGQVIGYVGDSGYGPEGTTGKFEPHLHFGIYVREGYLFFQREAVNPYVFLRMWDPKH